MKTKRLLSRAERNLWLLFGWFLFLSPQAIAVGTWTKINTDPPNWVSRMTLLSDGTILAQMDGSQSWERLTPDGQGIYINGSWSAVASMHDTREYYSSAVLQDGRYLVAGGEYGTGGTNAEVSIRSLIHGQRPRRLWLALQTPRVKSYPTEQCWFRR